MSKHSQKPATRDMTCPNCKAGACVNCVDRLRAIYANKPICTCTRQAHAVEVKFP